MSFVHATIQDLTTEGAPAIEVKFNPGEYTIQRNMSYSEVPVPGLQTPLLQFVRGEAQTLSLELFLDGSDRTSKRGVDDDLEQLRSYVTIQKDLHAPPVVEFKWASQTFQGVVTSFSEKFTLFSPDGHVLRARITLQLKRYTPAEIQQKKFDKQSPDRTKTRVVREGERIDLIAAEEYGDASLWRAIARANRLTRPRILEPGTLLVIPPL